jgi:hypothetical protein
MKRGALLDAIDTSSVAGLRDRALIGADGLHLRPRRGRGQHDGRNGFLKSHGIFDDYTTVDFERERAALKRLGL